MTEKQLEALIAQGEGFHLEFKESINSGLSKEIVAFVNAKGGVVLIGVDDDGNIKNKVLGNDDRSKIQSIARDCDPAIDLEIEPVDNENRVLVVRVKSGANKPYRCTSGFYMREGASSVKRTTAEIYEMFKEAERFSFDDKLVSGANFSGNYNPLLLKKFLNKSGIEQILSDEDTICNLGAAELIEGKYIFNNTGLLFFTDSIERFNKHAIIQCVKYHGNEKIDIDDQQDLTHDLITNIEDALLFLKKHLSVAFKFESGNTQRIEKWEIPFIALKEAIVNSVAHRDYVDKGTHIQLEIFDNRVSITNYGGLKSGFKIEDLGKRSYHRNPNIVSLLHRADYIEKLGTGILRINRELEKVGLPKVEFDVNEYWFTISFKRVDKNTYDVYDIPEHINDRARLVLEFCSSEPRSRAEIFEHIGIRNSTANFMRNLLPLIDINLLQFTHPDNRKSKHQKYYTTEVGKEAIKMK